MARARGKTRSSVIAGMEPKKVEFETYLRPHLNGQDYEQDTPSAFNGEIRIRRFRITVEEVEESNDILCERLQSLWEQGGSWQLEAIFKEAADELGYKLQGTYGSKA